MKPTLFALALLSTLAAACDRNPFGFGAGTGAPPPPGGVVPPPPGTTLSCAGANDYTIYRPFATLDACAVGHVFYARANSIEAARLCAINAGLAGVLHVYEGLGVAPPRQPVCVADGAIGTRADHPHHTADQARACVAASNPRLRVWVASPTAGSSC